MGYLAKYAWEPEVERLLDCLNPWLERRWNTKIVACKDEPYYLPASDVHIRHEIQFAHGYFNSVLHELAHWCVAGAERRLLPDYGYWYEPDGRSEQQQQMFEQVEVYPQALEWHFSLACNRIFQVSADNLTMPSEYDLSPFKQAVADKAVALFHQGLPSRAAKVVALIAAEFHTQPENFKFCW